jgi:hypothetical protein
MQNLGKSGKLSENFAGRKNPGNIAAGGNIHQTAPLGKQESSALRARQGGPAFSPRRQFHRQNHSRQDSLTL